MTDSRPEGREVYDARISENEIITPAAPDAPRINGPKVYGARPGKKIIYRIPCQGKRPIRFDVSNLPPELTLDPETAILTGTAPSEMGEYNMTLSAENEHGKASRAFSLVVGEEIALTPPAGWNHWGGHLSNINAGIIRKAADVIVNRGLADVGFQYVSIDDCWMRMKPEVHETIMNDEQGKFRAKHRGFPYDKVVGNTRDPYGNILPNSLFPDMKKLADYIHGHGLKAGIYSCPGEKTCQHMEGSYGYELQDAEQYARWGYDLLKYDLCSGGAVFKKRKRRYGRYHQKELWKPMIMYLQAQDRDILFNLCQYGKLEPWTWAPAIDAQSWRIGGDLNHNVASYFEQALRIASELREFSAPGHWNDPDFMYLGSLGNHADQFAPSKRISLTTNQQYQYVTLWSIVCAPFFFSCDITKIDEFTVRLLGNADVMNINQDELGHVAEVVRNDDSNETVMLKNLADNSKALAVFNRDPKSESVIDVTLTEIGLAGKPKLYDAWRQTDLGTAKEKISVRLSPDGAALFVVRD